MKTITLALALLLFGFNSTTALSRIIKLNCIYKLSGTERQLEIQNIPFAIIINTPRKKVCLQGETRMRASGCFPIIQNNDVSIIAAGAEWDEHVHMCKAKFRKQTTITINKSDMSGSHRLNTRVGMGWSKSLNRIACLGNERYTRYWTFTCTRRLD
jgi:hypothetical protein